MAIRPRQRVTTLFFAALQLLACVPASTATRIGLNATDARAKTVLHVGGFFAFPDSPLLGFLQSVAQTALDHINSLDGILDDYHLEMRWNWTGVCSD